MSDVGYKLLAAITACVAGVLSILFLYQSLIRHLPTIPTVDRVVYGVAAAWLLLMMYHLLALL